MKILVTGASGFVGAHFLRKVREMNKSVQILATSKVAGELPYFGSISALDVSDSSSVESFIAEHVPTHLVHLAGIASPAMAAADPELAWRVHLHGTINVANAIIKRAPECRLLFVGSGMVYGASAGSVNSLDEETMLQPLDDYAATKAAADLALGAFVQKGLKVVRARPFNHTGAGQQPTFAAPSFAMQIARIEKGLQPPIMSVGNLQSERDLLDVRDVAKAYIMILQSFDRMPNGIILNIASGRALQIKVLLEILLSLSSAKIEIVHDPSLIRSAEIPRVVGDVTRVTRLLGWSPSYKLMDTMRYLLEDCRSRVESLDKLR